jgi:hypothetical protein
MSCQLHGNSFLELEQKNMIITSLSSTITTAATGDIKGKHFCFFGDENGVGNTKKQFILVYWLL